MRCQANSRACQKEAAFVRDIPNLGESLCFCVECVNREIVHHQKDFGWYVLTLEREKQEREAEENFEVWKRRMRAIPLFNK